MEIIKHSFAKKSFSTFVVALIAFSATTDSMAASAAIANGKPFQLLQSQVDNLQAQLDAAVADLNKRINDANALINQLFAISGTNTAEINELKLYVAGLQQQLNLLSGNLSKDCGSGYFVQKIQSNGVPVCAKDMGNGFYNILQEVIFPPVNYYPYDIKCPASHPRAVSGGYVETPVTWLTGSKAVIDSANQDSWRFFVNGVGAIVLSTTCSTN